MSHELFMVPMQGVGTELDPYMSKYADDPAVEAHGTIRYSRQDHAICMIRAPQVYLDFVAAQVDVTRLATAGNIDQVLTVAQANAAKTVFEDAFVPGQFINAGDTRREVLRGVIGMFLFSQRMEGRFGVGWKAKAQAQGITLDSTWQQFPQALKNEFIDVRDTFGWTTATLGVSNASTLREILVVVSQQFEQTPFFICNVEV
jgi:hypothetical protein